MDHFIFVYKKNALVMELGRQTGLWCISQSVAQEIRSALKFYAIPQDDGVEGATGPARHRQRSQAVVSADPRSSGKRRTSWTFYITQVNTVFLNRLRFDEVTVMSWCYTFYVTSCSTMFAWVYSNSLHGVTYSSDTGFDRGIWRCLLATTKIRLKADHVL